jgi:hypothetical protein
VSGILLNEADSLVEVTRLLDEEQSRKGKRASKAPVPWGAAIMSKNGGGMSKPQLTQEWINALDQMSEKGAPWHEVTKNVPLLSYFLDTFVSVALLLHRAMDTDSGRPLATAELLPGESTTTIADLQSGSRDC